MNDIKCPNCGQSFKISEASYADIVKQVRDHQFEEEINDQIETAVSLAVERAKNASNDDIAKISADLTKLEAEKEKAITELTTAKDILIAQLEAKVKNPQKNRKTRVSLPNLIKTDATRTASMQY